MKDHINNRNITDISTSSRSVELSKIIQNPHVVGNCFPNCQHWHADFAGKAAFLAEQLQLLNAAKAY